MKKFFIMLTLVAIAIGCKKEDPVAQAEIDETIITTYIADNALDAKATGTGLYYVVDVQGTGDTPAPTEQVRVAYKGYFTDGQVFDESPSEGIAFFLSSVIKGWTEGIPKFSEGGKGKLLIPSALGYGSQDRPGIPRNSVLIFDVELIEVL